MAPLIPHTHKHIHTRTPTHLAKRRSPTSRASRQEGFINVLHIGTVHISARTQRNSHSTLHSTVKRWTWGDTLVSCLWTEGADWSIWLRVWHHAPPGPAPNNTANTSVTHTMGFCWGHKHTHLINSPYNIFQAIQEHRAQSLQWRIICVISYACVCMSVCLCVLYLLYGSLPTSIQCRL